MRESPPPRITISQRSRPLRFGYLLRGLSDRPGLRAGIRMFTSLWGRHVQLFHPGVSPSSRSVERIFSRGPEITRGYLDAFEPDFLVAEDSWVGRRSGLREESHSSNVGSDTPG